MGINDGICSLLHEAREIDDIYKKAHATKIAWASN